MNVAVRRLHVARIDEPFRIVAKDGETCLTEIAYVHDVYDAAHVHHMFPEVAIPTREVVDELKGVSAVSERHLFTRDSSQHLVDNFKGQLRTMQEQLWKAAEHSTPHEHYVRQA